MKNIQEKTHKIDGVDSWIHVLHITGEGNCKIGVPEIYHYHDYIEVLYALEDFADVWINGHNQRIYKGDLFIINSQEPHEVMRPTSADYICIKFSPQILYADEQALFEYHYVTPFLGEERFKTYFNEMELKCTNVKELCEDILNEWENKNSAYELAIRADILKLFTVIFRKLYSYLEKNDKVALPEIIKNALEFIVKNYTTVTEKECADHCGLSYNYFSAYFKERMGTSFKDYLTATRLAVAKKLMITTKKDLTEIAYETGFSSSSHFVACFKNKFGVTPKQLRKKIVKN